MGTSTEPKPKVKTALIRTIAFDLSGPIATFYILRAVGLGVVPSSLLAAVLPLGNAVVLFLRRRKVDQVACLTAAIMLVLVVVTLLNGDQRLVMAKDALITGFAGLWVLGTLFAARPMFFSVARPFGEEPGEDWDALWSDNARFRRTMTVVTSVWGVVLTLDAVVKVVLCYTLPIDSVPAITGVQYGVVFAALVLFTVLYVKRHGDNNAAAVGTEAAAAAK